MFSYELFKMYQESKGYNQSQCAAALGFGKTFVTQLKNGSSKLRTEIAIQIAEELNLNTDEVFLKLQAERAKNAEESSRWENILKKLSSGQTLAISSLAALVGTLHNPILDCAYCTDMVNTGKLTD